MTDTALLLQNTVLPALELGAHRGTLSRSVAELGMAQCALVLVKGVLAAPETLRIFELRVADKAAILVTVVLRTPQSPGIPQTRVADKTVGIRKTVTRAACALHILVAAAVDLALQRRLW